MLYCRINVNLWVMFIGICCKLSTLMGEERYNIQEVYDLTGLSRGTISNLHHDKMQRIDYEIWNKLCELF